MTFKTLLFLLLVSLSLSSYSQFNDSTHHFIAFNASGNVNKTNTTDAYILNNALKFSIRSKKMVLNFNNSWLYGKQNRQLSNNDYIASLDFNLYQKDASFYYWGLGNYTTSYSLKIINQLQSGLGLAYNIINTERAQLNISDGILYETSKLLVNERKDYYQTFRNSLRIYFKYSLKNVIVLDGIGFLQNSLNYKDDYIINTSSGLSLILNKYLSLNTSLKYNKITKTRSENLILTYGFKAEKYF